MPHHIRFNSSEWQAIKEYCEGKLEIFRQQNDEITLDPIQTAVIRGQISMCKEIIGLEKSDNEINIPNMPAGEGVL
jgi:hypothetical protein